MTQLRMRGLARVLVGIAIAALIVAQSPASASADAMGTMGTMGKPSTMPTVAKGVLVDQHGMTLYTFAKDTAGTSNCIGTCADIWPPLLAPSGSTASGKFSIITRKDGEKQWAYDGKPLYLFAKDTAPGQEKGNGVKGLWAVVKP
ncbi:MAG TPA: hypothetical protein VMV65_05280 [Alphaproteobacteria bacterium]|nr:hypothetical protein [Alphaproteobacteria bacterium]